MTFKTPSPLVSALILFGFVGLLHPLAANGQDNARDWTIEELERMEEQDLKTGTIIQTKLTCKKQVTEIKFYTVRVLYSPNDECICDTRIEAAKARATEYIIHKNSGGLVAPPKYLTPNIGFDIPKTDETEILLDTLYCYRVTDLEKFISQ